MNLDLDAEQLGMLQEEVDRVRNDQQLMNHIEELEKKVYETTAIKAEMLEKESDKKKRDFWLYSKADSIIDDLRGARITYLEYREIRKVLDIACDDIRVPSPSHSLPSSGGDYNVECKVDPAQVQEYINKLNDYMGIKPDEDIEFIDEKEMEI